MSSIGPISPQPLFPSSGLGNDVARAQSFASHLDRFSRMIQSLNHDLAHDPEFQRGFATVILSLKENVLAVQEYRGTTSLQENLEDAAQIVQNILVQPLTLPGSAANISLLKAAQEYLDSKQSSPELSKILHAFMDYPGPTRTMVNELELLIKDLTVA